LKKAERKTAEGILYTDEYQLTMCQLYYRAGLHEKKVQFDHFFRSYPDYKSHKAGYCINAGLEWLVEWIQQVRFRDEDIDFLKSQTGQTGTRIFEDDFLEWLKINGNFGGLTIKAIPEGRVVHANVPLTVVEGPIVQAQLLESSLLNHLNYQTLIATKACRIRESGRGGLLLEFGLRRAQEKGANAGARAALIGGADFTSNTGISHVLGYPPKGTHAHSMVQLFMALGDSELDAFEKYAEVYPDDCLLLVDTIDTLESGIPNAIRVFEQLRKKGHKPIGIRLDSGDLAYLSIQAAKMLDDAGFPDVSIVLSNQLDEMVIWQIITQIENEAAGYGVKPERLIKRLVYGVGTNLIVSKGDSALDGVYKLVSVYERGKWAPAIKVSETPEKVTNPGSKKIWRLYDKRGIATADLMSLEEEEPSRTKEILLRHPVQRTAHRTLSQDEVSDIEPLLVDVMKGGKVVYEFPTIEEIRKQRERDISCLDTGVRRLLNPHVYHVSLTQNLWDLKQRLINSFKNQTNEKRDDSE